MIKLKNIAFMCSVFLVASAVGIFLEVILNRHYTELTLFDVSLLLDALSRVLLTWFLITFAGRI